MIPFVRPAALAVAALGLALTVNAASAQKTCTNKAGEGTNTTADGARFQAWEAVLQAYDWGVWAAMMSSKQEVGAAPGVTVRGLKSRCAAGGLGQVCVVQAQLCR
jgi:hypothetical protein